MPCSISRRKTSPTPTLSTCHSVHPGPVRFSAGLYSCSEWVCDALFISREACVPLPAPCETRGASKAVRGELELSSPQRKNLQVRRGAKASSVALPSSIPLSPTLLPACSSSCCSPSSSLCFWSMQLGNQHSSRTMPDNANPIISKRPAPAARPQPSANRRLIDDLLLGDARKWAVPARPHASSSSSSSASSSSVEKANDSSEEEELVGYSSASADEEMDEPEEDIDADEVFGASLCPHTHRST